MGNYFGSGVQAQQSDESAPGGKASHETPVDGCQPESVDPKAIVSSIYSETDSATGLGGEPTVSAPPLQQRSRHQADGGSEGLSGVTTREPIQTLSCNRILNHQDYELPSDEWVPEEDEKESAQHLYGPPPSDQYIKQMIDDYLSEIFLPQILNKALQDGPVARPLPSGHGDL